MTSYPLRDRYLDMEEDDRYEHPTITVVCRKPFISKIKHIARIIACMEPMK